MSGWEPYFWLLNLSFWKFFFGSFFDFSHRCPDWIGPENGSWLVQNLLLLCHRQGVRLLFVWPTARWIWRTSFEFMSWAVVLADFLPVGRQSPLVDPLNLIIPLLCPLRTVFCIWYVSLTIDLLFFCDLPVLFDLLLSEVLLVSAF